MRHSRLRARIEERAGSRCEYCQAPQSICGYRFHLEHIIPLSLGGSDTEDNRALACASCNLVKSQHVTARDPLTNEETPLFHPRIHIWSEHFAWAEDHRALTGLSVIGRATVAMLDMNSELRQAARELWFAIGMLPQRD